MNLKDFLIILQNTQRSLKSSPAYVCGGTPRDRYLGNLKNISDLDITTGDNTIHHLAQGMYDELRKSFNVMKKTMSDGHSTIYFGNIKIDFSSNFNVPNIDIILNKLGIKNPINMQKEVFSRDYTCNSLLLSLDFKNVVDITKRGMKDIDNKLIKTCLSPEITLTSNKNRVIRAIYLAAKLDFSIDKDIVNFVKLNPNSVKIASSKTLNEKLLSAFEFDKDKTKYYIDKMNLWNYLPITKDTYQNLKEQIGASKAKV